MSLRRWLLVPLVLVGLAQPAPAGFIFRKTKPPAADRVPELIQTLKSDPDEHKRADAALDLKSFDPQTFTQIVPALVDALQHDESPAVRAEAADAIGKLRPVNPQAGFALEQSLANDKVFRVRSAARSALWLYHLHGYRPAKPPEEAKDQAKEPPLATPVLPTPPPRPVLPPTTLRPGESPEPPLAGGVAAPTLTPPPLPAPASVGKPALPPQPVPASPPPFPQGFRAPPLPTPVPAMKPLPTTPMPVGNDGPALNAPG